MGLSLLAAIAGFSAALAGAVTEVPGADAPRTGASSVSAKSSPQPSPQPSQGYLGGFCGPIVLGESDEGALMNHLASWGARPVSDAEADAARPEDIDLPGQLFRFSRAGAPAAFIERRREECALVFHGAATPAAVLDELNTETLPVGDHGARQAWRRVSRTRFGPPTAPKYFIKVGDGDGFGLCSVLYEDLRLRDGTAATVAKVSVCRLLKDEKTDNG